MGEQRECDGGTEGSEGVKLCTIYNVQLICSGTHCTLYIVSGAGDETVSGGGVVCSHCF